MSVKAMAFVWEYSEQKSTKLLMLLGIADHCDDDGKCFPGVKRLQLKTRLENYKSASRIICDLEMAGEVTIVRRRGRSSIYYLTKFCEVNGLSIPQMVDTIDVDDPPPNGGQGIPKTVDDPPPNGGQGIPKTVDDPPPNGGLESSVKSSVDPSVEPSVESSSSKSKGDDDDFKLNNKERKIVFEVFGAITAVAKKGLLDNRERTVGLCEYVIATRRCLVEEHAQYVRTPARWMLTMINNNDPVPDVPVMTAEREAFDLAAKEVREQEKYRAGFTDDQWAAKVEQDQVAIDRDAALKTANGKAKRDADAEKVEASRLATEAAKLSREQETSSWNEKREIERKEWRQITEQKLKNNGNDRLAVIEATSKAFKGIASIGGAGNAKWQRLMISNRLLNMSDLFKCVRCGEEEIKLLDGTKKCVEVLTVIFSHHSDAVYEAARKLSSDSLQPFVRVISALQYHEVNADG